MKILMYGVNKETVMEADVDKYRLDNQKKRIQMQTIRELNGVEEIIILDNDFRNEYYLYVDEKTFSHGDFLRYLAGETNKNLEEIILETYSMFNEDVLRHLYEVSSGYLSHPLGSFSTLDSVEQALKFAVFMDTCGQVLYKLFTEAIQLAYYLKLKEKIQPLNKSKISEYLYRLKKRMGSLEKKNYVLAGDDFEVFYLTKLLLIANAQTITIVHKNVSNAKRQKELIKAKLEKSEQTKIHYADEKSIHYRLSKSDVVIFDTSKLNLLNKKIREEVAAIRRTPKIQYLLDTSEHPIEAIKDEQLDLYTVDVKMKLSYNDEQKNKAIIAFDEELSEHIDRFMNYLKEIHVNVTEEAMYQN